ncbi:hypothetical protein D3C84_1234450 [compost metagenome]
MDSFANKFKFAAGIDFGEVPLTLGVNRVGNNHQRSHVGDIHGWLPAEVLAAEEAGEP